ncbi:uncharacterized protein [Rutidosis leptorrhynchoides]|uniref:uncharacterized protein n=1 Tax=Rutidosis leptorrhynchoides TaxID=125765 RepID=UPI003A98CFCE
MDGDLNAVNCNGGAGAVAIPDMDESTPLIENACANLENASAKLENARAKLENACAKLENGLENACAKLENACVKLENACDGIENAYGGVENADARVENVNVRSKNCNARVDNHLELFYHALLFLTQYAMLLSVIQSRYEGKTEIVFEAHAFSVISFVCSFMVFGSTLVLLFVDHYVTIFTIKSLALYRILIHV